MKTNMKRIAATVMAVLIVFGSAPCAMAAEYYSGSLKVNGLIVRPTAEPTAAPATEEPAAEPTAAPATEEPAAEPTAAPATEEPEQETAEEAIVYAYELDEDGNLLLDENGDPIAIVPEGAERPIRFARDENGSLLLDENGKPIVTATVPDGANIVSSLQDALDPNRYIDIYAAWEGDVLYFGTDATLIAVLYGYDNAAYTLQWQTSKDNVNWTDVEGATQDRHSIVVNRENYLDYWRILVTVTEITDAE